MAPPLRRDDRPGPGGARAVDRLPAVPVRLGDPRQPRGREDVRILDATEQDFGIPDQDWWMLDESSVVHLNICPDGTQINRELVDKRAESCPELKRLALANSVPFLEYSDGYMWRPIPISSADRDRIRMLKTLPL